MGLDETCIAGLKDIDEDAKKLLSYMVKDNLKHNTSKSLMIIFGVGKVNFNKMLYPLLDTGYVARKRLPHSVITALTFTDKAYRALSGAPPKNEIRKPVQTPTPVFDADKIIADCSGQPINRGIDRASWPKRDLHLQKQPKEHKKDPEEFVYQPYYKTSTQGKREAFMKVYNSHKKVATAHLYRKSMAKVCSTDVPQQ